MYICWVPCYLFMPYGLDVFFERSLFIEGLGVCLTTNTLVFSFSYSLFLFFAASFFSSSKSALDPQNMHSK